LDAGGAEQKYLCGSGRRVRIPRINDE
jgi:hypothetical protein